MQVSIQVPTVVAFLCIFLISLTHVELVEASPIELENGKYHITPASYPVSQFQISCVKCTLN